MKELSLLVWISQLGLSIAAPLAGFIILASWVQERFCLGSWVLWVGIALGVFCAIDGFLRSLKTLNRLARDKKKADSPPVTFHDHE